MVNGKWYGNKKIRRHAELVSSSCCRACEVYKGECRLRQSASYQLSILDRSRNKFGMTILYLLILFFFGCSCAQGATAPVSKNINEKYPILQTTLPPVSQAPTMASPVTPQSVDFGMCFKFFKMSKQKLFYLTLAGINANRFKIEEIQTKSGYILFSVSKRNYLASVISIDPQTSMLKITPCNNVYYFPVGIVQNMFKYIELNQNTVIEKLNIT